MLKIQYQVCSQLELTTNDKLAAIAHEIGHIIYFFLENKPIDEELKADPDFITFLRHHIAQIENQ